MVTYTLEGVPFVKSDTVSNFHWNDLETRLRSIKTLQEPTKPVGEEDHVVGEMDDHMRRLFTVLMEMTSDHESKTKRFDKLFSTLPKQNPHDVLADVRSLFTDAPREVQETAREVELLAKEIDLLTSEHRTVKANFYHELLRRHPALALMPNIGVRKGWKVCWSEVPESQFMNAIVISLGPKVQVGESGEES